MTHGAKGLVKGFRGWVLGLTLEAMILWAVFIPQCAHGEKGNSTDRRASRPQDPLEVQADRLEFRRKAHLTIYSGNVVAEQEEYRLRCHRLEVHWNPESGKIARMIARGKVRLKTKEGLATSEVALLDLPSRAIILSQSPKLVYGKEFVEGQRIIYSISERKSTVMGGRGKRVKSQLIPEGSRP